MYDYINFPLSAAEGRESETRKLTVTEGVRSVSTDTGKKCNSFYILTAVCEGHASQNVLGEEIDLLVCQCGLMHLIRWISICDLRCTSNGCKKTHLKRLSM